LHRRQTRTDIDLILQRVDLQNVRIAHYTLRSPST
jgi:hypothetical protein